jgi:hypothetical protein
MAVNWECCPNNPCLFSAAQLILHTNQMMTMTSWSTLRIHLRSISNTFDILTVVHLIQWFQIRTALIELKCYLLSVMVGWFIYVNGNWWFHFMDSRQLGLGLSFIALQE